MTLDELEALFRPTSAHMVVLRGPELLLERASPSALSVYGGASALELPFARVAGASQETVARLGHVLETGNVVQIVDVTYQRLWPGYVVGIGVEATDAVRHRRIMKAARVGVWEIDYALSTAIIDDNAALLFGLPAGEQPISALHEVLHPDDRARLAARIDSGELGEGNRDLDQFRLAASDGVERWLSVRGHVDLDGDRLVRWTGTVVDITARKTPELERERAHADVAQSLGRLQAQLEQAPVAVSIITAPEFRYVQANPLYEMAVGRSNLAGRTLVEAFPDLGPGNPIIQMLDGVATTGTPFVADEYRVPLDRGTGVLEDVYFKFSCAPVRNRQGVVTEIMTVLVDVTAMVEARRKIEALNEDLRLGDQRKDEFLAMLAHELRNPLAAISNALSLLDDPTLGEAQNAQCRVTARRQTGNLVRLVDDMLDVARITRGQVELQRSAVDLSTLVRHALDVVRPPVAARRHELVVELPPEGTPLHADGARLEQVVVNLVTNAAKYTDPGGRIVVRVAREDREAVLRVRDTGRGIPLEMKEAVFGLFTQVAPSVDRATGGLGLGLTLVRRLVEMHGGTVVAESEGAGMGSELVVRLPLADVQATREVSTPSSEASRRRVLLIEDADDVREMMAALLERKGHTVISAVDGEEGIAKFVDGDIEVALVDVGLPTIDGYEVARRIRAMPNSARVQLVALTGYGGEGAAARAAEAGFDEHLTKPVQMARLNALLARGRRA